MSRHGYFLWILSLAVIASLSLACGTNPNTTSTTPVINVSDPQHQIVSLSITPATADAKDFLNGQVPFLVTGTYNSPPFTVTPLPAHWVVVDENGSQTAQASINSNGLAQCATGVSGTFTIGAWETLFEGQPKAICNVVSPFGNPCGNSVLGTAQLICP